MLHKNRKRITHIIQSRLLIIMLVAFLVSALFIWFFETSLCKRNAARVLLQNLSDVSQDVSDSVDNGLLAKTITITADLSSTLNDMLSRVKNADFQASDILTDEYPIDIASLQSPVDMIPHIFVMDSEFLRSYAASYGATEISYIDPNGIITASSNPEFIGFDMHSGEQSREFLCLLDGSRDTFIQEYRSIAADPTQFRQFAGAAADFGGFFQISYDEETLEGDIAVLAENVTANRHVGETGGMIIFNYFSKMVSLPKSLSGEVFTPDDLGITAHPKGMIYPHTIKDTECYCLYDIIDGYRVFGYMPIAETLNSRNVSVKMLSVAVAVTLICVLFMVYRLLSKVVIKNLSKVNASLSKIADGDLSEAVNVRENREFDSLSTDINATVDTLKRYISDAEKRIDAELALAKAIQHSALPYVFPPFPDRKDFDIWADMFTAKEVGGDFYDFFFAGPSVLAFLIADVSGKGIPAAMFMMRAKTLIKSYAESGLPLAEVISTVNRKLCEGNDTEQFVTAWIGFLDTKTGEVEFINAGHNPPLLCSHGNVSWIRTKPGLVLAAFDSVRYKSGSFHMDPGDTLFLYTDGVTEACDANDTLFGEERLYRSLCDLKDAAPEEICGRIKKDVDAFASNRVQFDDITMLCLKYIGGTDHE